MDPAQMKQMEALCDVLFAPGSTPAAKKSAGTTLMVLGSAAKYIPQCQTILDKSTNQYALYVAATSLTKLISEHWNNFTEPQRVDIRNYMMTYLAGKGPHLQPFVITALIQMLCRITKLGWFDSGGKLRTIVTMTTKFLQETVQHCIIGLKILNELVVEFNHPSARRSISAHRKVAVSFRDESLFYTFEIAMTMLQQIIKGSMGVTDLALEDQVLEQALKLVVNCLSYDFIGTNPDESADEVGTIQLPLKWRGVVENAQTMATFFDLYQGSSLGAFARGAAGSVDVGMGTSTLGPMGSGAGAGAGTGSTRSSIPVRPKRAAEALECLVLFISVRRSVFTSESNRRTFLINIMGGVCNIMRHEIGLSDQDCYHQFCRLLGKLKANYQLSDLVRTAGYTEWIKLASDFAIRSFRQMHIVANSIHYILGLWSRLVAAAPHVSAEALKTRSPMLDTYTPKVAFAYLEARVGMVESALAGKIMDDLEDEGLVLQQLEQLPIVVRYRYQDVASKILAIMDPLLLRVNEALTLLHTAPNPSVAASLKVMEVQLAWIVYYIGAVIGGQGFSRRMSNASKGHELVDADLSRRVIQLMMAMDMRLSSTGGRSKSDYRLELAMLYYAKNFRMSYIGEQHGMPTPGREGSKPISTKQKTFKAMFDRMGQGSHTIVVSTIIQKIANNLRFWSENEDIIKATLTLFSELAWTYSSVKLLLTLTTVKHVLTHHTAEHFPFLALPSNTRERTTFYTALARLLFMKDDPEVFAAFMAPIVHVLSALKGSIHLRSNEVMRGLIGVCRDLRGIAKATNSKRTYTLLFDVLYPAHFAIFSQAVAVWYDRPEVTTPVLKLMVELVTNTAERISFGNMSPNGILLFREASKVITAYGAKIIGMNPTREPYTNKYKGISICLQMLSVSLAGNYVQFGVFELYNDKALDSAMEAAIRMALCIPLEQIMAHPKVAAQYFRFIDSVCRSYMKAIVSMESAVFIAIVKSIQEGLDSVARGLAMHAANSIDSLASFFVRNARKETPTARALRAHITATPTVFATFTNVLFGILVFGECKNQWALARPLLSLLLASEIVRPDSFNAFKAAFIATQPAEFHPRLQSEFDGLMKDVNTTLDVTNRERFTAHLTAFRNNVRSFVKF